MAITGRGRPTYLLNQNKHICLWHQQLAHVSNTYVVRAIKLVDIICLEQEGKEYNLAKVLIDSNNFNIILNGTDKEELPIQLSVETSISAIYKTIENLDVINKICTLCISRKST